MPAGKTIKIGVWEDNIFIGCVVFSRGANKYIGKPYNLEQTQVCELTRVALNKHSNTVTKILKIAIRLLKKFNDIKLVVSYADTAQGHLGKIYQASNWIYTGFITDCNQLINGKVIHRRTVYSKYGRQDIKWLKANVDKNAKWVKNKPKHKYLYPLDKEIKKQIEPLSKPYPKRLK